VRKGGGPGRCGCHVTYVVSTLCILHAGVLEALLGHILPSPVRTKSMTDNTTLNTLNGNTNFRVYRPT
jgi:hypothetical protein